MKTLVGQEIKAVLAKKFVKCDEIARILTLAFRGQQNVILWGPGGHGKSEMVEAAVRHLVEEDQHFCMSFGEGTDEAALWGGIDFEALDDGRGIRFHPERSFLAKKVAVFEEIFDAPAVVFTALKDTMSARTLRKGDQQFPMQTQVVIGISNKDPKNIADLDPSAAALVQRFPLQFHVKWDHYTASDYLELFALREPQMKGPEAPTEILEVISALLAKRNGNNPISPRTALEGLAAIKQAASLDGRDEVIRRDILDLRYIEGLEHLARDIEKQLDDAERHLIAEKRLHEQEVEADKVTAFYRANRENGHSPIKFLQAAHLFERLYDVVAVLQVTEDLNDRRKRLRDHLERLMEEAKDLAYRYTRVPADLLYDVILKDDEGSPPIITLNS